MKERIRILVLTSSTGGGHDARAKAFREWVELLYGDGVEVRTEQMLERSSVVHRGGVSFYNFIQRRAPWIHWPFYIAVEVLGLLNRGTVRLGRRYFMRVLQDYRPHLVLSVHDCLNRGYFPLARRVLGQQVRCCTIVSEFAGGFGFSRNWIEPTADLVFLRTPTAADYAAKLGMDRRRLRVRGHLLRPSSVCEVLDARQRRAFRQQHLALDPDRFTLLMATGGAGANNHIELAPLLARFGAWLQVIFICGRSEETRAALEAWSRREPRLRCAVLGFVDDMHLHLQASDAVFTRGGTTTCAKALHFGCPILFNTFGKAMPQERLTVKFFVRGHAARVAANPLELENILTSWRDDPDAYGDIRANFLKLQQKEKPTRVVEDLVEEAAAAAGQPAVLPRADWRKAFQPSEAFLIAAGQEG